MTLFVNIIRLNRGIRMKMLASEGKHLKRTKRGHMWTGLTACMATEPPWMVRG